MKVLLRDNFKIRLSNERTIRLKSMLGICGKKVLQVSTLSDLQSYSEGVKSKNYNGGCNGDN